MKHPTLNATPWVLATPGSAGVVGLLVSYPQMLRDSRVNRSDRLVLWRTGTKIVWTVSGSLLARRLDGPGTFRVRLHQQLRFPSSGCWRLTVRKATIIARVVAPPGALDCDLTVLSESGKAFVRPRSAGIYGGWTWRTEQNGALMYTHGVGPGDLNTKVPWFVRRGWGSSLELVGMRLDVAGSFKQEFSGAVTPQGVFPSIVDVPAPGCWLFRLRTGPLAGVLVVRAIDR